VLVTEVETRDIAGLIRSTLTSRLEMKLGMMPVKEDNQL
jgi:hypothetical protein